MKILGWIFVPYIMILFQWRKLGSTGRILGTTWAAIALIIGISGAIGGSQYDDTTATLSSTPPASTTPSPSATPESSMVVVSPVPPVMGTPESIPPVIESAEPMPTVTGSASPMQRVEVEVSGDQVSGINYDDKIEFPADKYPETAAHILAAINSGESPVCTIDRKDAEEHRSESLKGIATKDGYDRDEWPMAMCAEGGSGADIAYVTPSDNGSSTLSWTEKMRGSRIDETIRSG